MKYEDLIKNVFSQKDLLEFIKKSLDLSLEKLGFSRNFIDDLSRNLTNLNLEEFIAKHDAELENIQIQNFFNNLVPKYFSDYVVPEIPKKGKVLDLGCGFGTLIQILKLRGENTELIGIDIKESSNWELVQDSNVRLEVVLEENFIDFVKKELPEIVVATWTLHHMEYTEQERYLKTLSEILKGGATMIILEDSYAESLEPEFGQKLYEEFMLQKPADRQKIMGALDWIANCILSKRTTMPVPFSYRTVEDWKKILEKTGFQVTKMRFLGFPKDRDINTPQSIIVARKL